MAEQLQPVLINSKQGGSRLPLAARVSEGNSVVSEANGLPPLRAHTPPATPACHLF